MADLTQTGISITAGQTYRISFNVDVTSGTFVVYQGTQQIYDWSVRDMETHSHVYVFDIATIARMDRLDKFDSVSITESVVMSVI